MKDIDPGHFESVQPDNQSSEINFRELFDTYAHYYKWFVLGLIVTLTVAYFYVLRIPNTYMVTSTILIEDDKGGLGSELSAIGGLGLAGGNTSSIDNELGILNSYSLMEQIVKDLKLNVSYAQVNKFSKTALFVKQAPFKINFLVNDSLLHTQSGQFYINILSKTSYKLINQQDDSSSTHSFGEPVSCNFGLFELEANATLSNYIGQDIIVNLSSLEGATLGYRARIVIGLADKNSRLVKLSLVDALPQKSRMIIDYLVYKYNEQAKESKSLTARRTDAFIKERLAFITSDLSSIDKGVENFKSKNKLIDFETQAGLMVGNNNAINQKIIEINTQLKLVEFLTDFVNKNKNGIIPENLGIADADTNLGTSEYNALLLQRNRILKGSSDSNPVIQNLDEDILKLRESLNQTLINLKATLQITLQAAKQEEDILDTKITAVPRQEREFRDIMRQQQIIETLYLFLLQKREENAITLAITEPNAIVIDKAYGSSMPVGPKSKTIYMAAGLLGLLIPFAVLYLMFMLDNKANSVEDIEKATTLPIIGQLPEAKNKDQVLVETDDGSGLDEALRMVRTNINFMLSGKTDKAKCVLITSTISGEGKTFIAINLAHIMALLNKKVLLIGCDIRNPKLNQYLSLEDKKGLTHFLADDTLTPKDLIVTDPTMSFDLIQSGIIPPNPSELLMNGRFSELISYAKEHYDFVVVDTAPVSLVTDTLLLDHSTIDLSIFVTRVQYLDKRLLSYAKKLKEDKRLPNMVGLVNYVNTKKSGYGYGYGYGKTVDKPWYKKVFSKKA